MRLQVIGSFSITLMALHLFLALRLEKSARRPHALGRHSGTQSQQQFGIPGEMAGLHQVGHHRDICTGLIDTFL